MSNILTENKNAIDTLCSKHGVSKLFAFGSVLTEKFNDNSDIDLIVDFNPIELAKYADNYYDFKFSLENIFQKPIDLLEEKAIKNPYFLQVVNQQRRLIYGH
ncbi:MAG TPA: nucleotidyltransferase domain-containing protein [Chitinophagaceae bacterium]|nr:nucleotidyltransferase domain-containing protein [Chitinophagaceae bacterium]